MRGNYQRQICWDSSGYVYVITAEDDGYGNTRRISVYRSINGLFDLSGGFTFQADASLANGFNSDEIRDLAEFSAVLRNDRIYIAANFSDPPAVFAGVMLISYDINNQTFSKIDFMQFSTNTTPTPFISSLDLSCSPDRASGDIILSWLEYDSLSNPSVLKRRYLRELLPLYSSQGSGGTGNITELISSGP